MNPALIPISEPNTLLERPEQGRRAHGRERTMDSGARQTEEESPDLWTAHYGLPKPRVSTKSDLTSSLKREPGFLRLSIEEDSTKVSFFSKR